MILHCGCTRTRFVPELRFFRVPAGTNKKKHDQNSVVFREIEYHMFLCQTKVHSRKKFGLHKENV